MNFFLFEVAKYEKSNKMYLSICQSIKNFTWDAQPFLKEESAYLNKVQVRINMVRSEFHDFSIVLFYCLCLLHFSWIFLICTQWVLSTYFFTKLCYSRIPQLIWFQSHILTKLRTLKYYFKKLDLAKDSKTLVASILQVDYLHTQDFQNDCGMKCTRGSPPYFLIKRADKWQRRSTTPSCLHSEWVRVNQNVNIIGFPPSKFRPEGKQSCRVTKLTLFPRFLSLMLYE